MRARFADRQPSMPMFAVIAGLVLLLACSDVGPTAPGNDPGETPPPPEESEGIVMRETSQGRAAAELLASPEEIDSEGTVILRVANRGELLLGYGRPITVERWDGENWVETEESRESAWTMELIFVQPGQTGIEQRWPFTEDHDPEPGWYRFTKSVQAEKEAGDPEQLTLRARVRVLDR